GIGQRLEREQRLNACVADDPVGAILGVAVRETKISGRAANVGSGNEIQFVRAQRFIGIHQTVNAVILKIQVAGGGVEGVTGRIAQAVGEVRQVCCGDVGAVVGDGEQVSGIARQGPARAGTIVVAEGGG